MKIVEAKELVKSKKIFAKLWLNNNKIYVFKYTDDIEKVKKGSQYFTVLRVRKDIISLVLGNKQYADNYFIVKIKYDNNNISDVIRKNYNSIISFNIRDVRDFIVKDKIQYCNKKIKCLQEHAVVYQRLLDNIDNYIACKKKK